MADDHLAHHASPTGSKGENDPTNAVSLNTPGHRGDSSRDSNLGYAAIARRITGWTSNLLVTFLILAAGLAFGIQVLIWWKDAPNDGNSSSKAEPTESPTSAEAWAEFRGDGGRFSCFTIQADESTANRRAQEICREAAQQASFPSGLPDLAEQEILAKLANLSPVCEGPRGTRVYRYPGDFPVWVGIKMKEENPTGLDPLKSEGNLLLRESRIVAWTFLIPLGKREWTIYRASVEREIATEESAIVSNGFDMVCPTPPGASAISRFSPGSGTIFGIFQETSAGAAATWTLFLDRELQKAGWKPLHNWLGDPSRQRRTFTRRTPSAEEDFLTIEIIQKPGQSPRGLVFGFRWSTRGREMKTDDDPVQMRQGAE